MAYVSKKSSILLKAYIILFWNVKREATRNTRRRWEDYIKWIKKIEFEGVDSSALACGEMTVFSEHSTGPPKGRDISSIGSNS
jgi:hypothetical protein